MLFHVSCTRCHSRMARTHSDAWHDQCNWLAVDRGASCLQTPRPLHCLASDQWRCSCNDLFSQFVLFASHVGHGTGKQTAEQKHIQEQTDIQKHGSSLVVREPYSAAEISHIQLHVDIPDWTAQLSSRLGRADVCESPADCCVFIRTKCIQKHHHFHHKLQTLWIMLTDLWMLNFDWSVLLWTGTIYNKKYYKG